MINIYKIVGGIGVAVLIAAIYPILDLLEIFFTFVLIPFLFLVALGAVGEGTYNECKNQLVLADLRNRLDHYRSSLASADNTMN